MNSLFFSGGGTKDLLTAYDTSCEYAIFDMARCNDPKFFPWNFIENIKNGWITTLKYNGHMKCFTPPKVVIFMNQDPQFEKLSKDRVKIKYI